MIIHGSSQVIALDYDATKKELTVTWKSGGQGIYSNVNPTVHTRLLNSESKGSFIASVLKGNPRLYPYRKAEKTRRGPLTIPIGTKPEKGIKLEIEAEDIKIDRSSQKIEDISSRFHELIRKEKPKF